MKLFVLVIFISILSFHGCIEGESTIGGEFIESRTEITLIDTFSVKLSTVILDSVITSGTGSMLIGNYRDDILGKITSHSYFQVGIPDNFDVQNDCIYDSLNLVIRYNNYFFGDTTKSQKISVHQLTDKIEYGDNDIITRNTSFNFKSEPMGSIIYTPRPNNPVDTLSIKISDDIGMDLFTKLRDNSEILTDNERFLNYFKGLVLVADDEYGGSITGFSANEEDIKLILHTRRESLSSEENYHEFRLNDPNKQFNNITNDFASTPLKSLIEQRYGLPGAHTNGLSFLQGGAVLLLRVDFPTLREILLYDRGIIMQAQLSIAPLRGSYNDFDLPPQLVIYESDKLNRISDQGIVSSSELILDELYHEETAYYFDVTEYINDEIADSYVDPEKGFLIALSSDHIGTTFYRLVVEAQNQNTRLNIYYLSY